MVTVSLSICFKYLSMCINLPTTKSAENLHSSNSSSGCIIIGIRFLSVILRQCYLAVGAESRTTHLHKPGLIGSPIMWFILKYSVVE